MNAGALTRENARLIRAPANRLAAV